MEIPVDDGIVLYTYWRSSAAYRVRIALELKGLAWDARPVHLVREGGEQHLDAYRALNPQQLVPTLLHDGHTLTQSLAIVEYLDERFPQVPLLPADAAGRARVRALAQLVACDIHPINNLRVMQYLERNLQLPADARTQWTLHWIAEGLAAMEAMLASSRDTGTFCHGDRPGLADLCLLPQLYNAHRFGLDLTPYPTLLRIEAACQALDAFDRARPQNQPDAA
ncbi:maleylacetoacetate isomerase [Stenotrophomonas maltophilia]|uniref:Maleylacetoacetate isomerase n=2 Tax=Gammaproteobacteria TaxID=1236 RepID=A0ABY7Y2H8_9GAMM|nr:MULTISPECIES: maleylacetoacetate isomerase [Stenotrophomonas]ALA81057.1 maleylacetoacetate isomerase [Stenotrophomonas maltophilia]MBH1477555.1 maleylacetoacetate isomerase [Stenotrophomonas maltophilia]MBH1503447.1 maleylacetoacetate isomerase [Stenotrophomonas maltophilia]MBH1787452.1 maleylacetoacetate isomerase [Stenotrophomonas maltophilia]WDM64175.1 maleylacetoacetate isomerase [Stenotrophomonas sp. DFS-20110405]